MLELNSNIEFVFEDLAQKILDLAQGEFNVLRIVALSIQPVLRDRVHVQGIASDGSRIGEYSEGYMSVRTGVYKTNDEYSKGKNKGEIKNTGVFTKGINKGAQRPLYNRSADRKVILSLTRQMEGDLSVQPTENGYGLAYNNSLNFDKAKWAEETYGKKIFSLMIEERTQAIAIAQQYTNNKLSGESE